MSAPAHHLIDTPHAASDYIDRYRGATGTPTAAGPRLESSPNSRARKGTVRGRRVRGGGPFLPFSFPLRACAAVGVEIEGFRHRVRGRIHKVIHRTNHGEYDQRWRTVDGYSIKLENSVQRS